jgi:hypothetical protein
MQARAVQRGCACRCQQKYAYWASAVQAGLREVSLRLFRGAEQLLQRTSPASSVVALRLKLVRVRGSCAANQRERLTIGGCAVGLM